MSTSFVGAVVGLGVCVLAGLNAAQEIAAVSGQVGGQRVDSSTVAVAARGNLRDFAQSLASSRIPAGLVFTRQDPQEPRSEPVTRKLTGKTEELSKALEAFSAAHPDYAVGEAHASLFISQKQSPCVAPLNRRVQDVQLSGPVFSVLNDIMRKLDPTLSSVPPGAVSGGGTAGATRPIAMSGRVSLHASQTTLLDLLQQISQQLPGLVWSVIDGLESSTGRRACKINWFEADSTTVTSFNILWGPGRGN